MFSFVAIAGSPEIHVHLDREGIAELRGIINRVESFLGAGRTDHLDLFSSAWAPDGELSQWMPSHEAKAGAVQIHHLKLFVHSNGSDVNDANAV